MFGDPNMNLYQMCAKIRSRQLDAADHVRRAVNAAREFTVVKRTTRA